MGKKKYAFLPIKIRIKNNVPPIDLMKSAKVCLPIEPD